MWHEREELRRRDINVLLVSFEALERVRRYVAEDEIEWPILSDEAHELCEAYGLGRASLMRTWLSPRTIAYYCKAAFGGKKIRRPTSDTGQLGGDFLIDPVGRIVFAFRSAEPADRPRVRQILEAQTKSLSAKLPALLTVLLAVPAVRRVVRNHAVASQMRDPAPRLSGDGGCRLSAIRVTWPRVARDC